MLRKLIDKYLFKEVRGWKVSIFYSDTPLCSKRFAMLSQEQQAQIADQIREQRRQESCQCSCNQ